MGKKRADAECRNCFEFATIHVGEDPLPLSILDFGLRWCLWQAARPVERGGGGGGGRGGFARQRSTTIWAEKPLRTRKVLGRRFLLPMGSNMDERQPRADVSDLRVYIARWMVVYLCDVHTTMSVPRHFQRALDIHLLLRAAYCAVRAEFDALPQTMITERHRSPREWGTGVNVKSLLTLHARETGWMYAWKDAVNPNLDWKNFGLVFGGSPIGRNSSLCPRTMQVLQTIPGLEVAGFSLLLPRGRIPPHVDRLHPRNRTFHLGIRIGGCSVLEIATPHLKYRFRHFEGSTLMFDSRCQHAAINAHDDVRAVLYLDIRM